MITYEFDGSSNHVSIDQLYSLVDFAFAQLGLLQYDELYLSILFSDEFDEGVCGYCNGIDDELVEIELNENIEHRELAATIFHELVHVRQVLEGRLVQGEGNNPSTWDGKAYVGYRYEQRPWEIEAHELEQQLMERYFES